MRGLLFIWATICNEESYSELLFVWITICADVFYRELLFVWTAAGRLSFAPAVFSSPSGRGINGIDERKDFGYVGEIPVIHRYPLLYVLLLYPFIAVKIFDSVLIKI